MATGVLDVCTHAYGGGKIRPLIETPLVGSETSEHGLLKGKMSLDPRDIGKLMPAGENDMPEITVLPRGQGVGPENDSEPIGHISAIRKNMYTAWGTNKGLQYGGDFCSLGGLPGARNRP